ncbi:M23 family metallopeptidase [Spirosoma linguale]
MDIAQPAGTPVYATAFGVVKWVKWEVDGLGLAVCIKHPTGYESIYGHLSTHAVRERNIIQQGAIIGQVGSTGRSTGPHLHYAILFQGKPVDPDRYCFLWIKQTKVDSSQIQQHRLIGPGIFQKSAKRIIERD